MLPSLAPRVDDAASVYPAGDQLQLLDDTDSIDSVSAPIYERHGLRQTSDDGLFCNLFFYWREESGEPPTPETICSTDRNAREETSRL
jgi:hypothetical protein